MKEYIHFVMRVAVALVIIYAVCDLIARLAGFNLKGYLNAPLAPFLGSGQSQG